MGLPISSILESIQMRNTNEKGRVSRTNWFRLVIAPSCGRIGGDPLQG